MSNENTTLPTMNNRDEYYFKEGCYIQEWHNTQNDSGLSIAHVRVEAKQTTKLHTLKETTERYTILSGQAVVSVNGEKKSVSQGDVVVIPAGAPQQITNLGDDDLCFLAICTPRFKEENYAEV